MRRCSQLPARRLRRNRRGSPVQGVGLRGNPKLRSLAGLQRLSRLAGWLTVEDNAALKTLGMPALEPIDGPLLRVLDNPLLPCDAARAFVDRLETVPVEIRIDPVPRCVE